VPLRRQHEEILQLRLLGHLHDWQLAAALLALQSVDREHPLQRRLAGFALSR
jgi:hypothetical protein